MNTPKCGEKGASGMGTRFKLSLSTLIWVSITLSQLPDWSLARSREPDHGKVAVLSIAEFLRLSKGTVVTGVSQLQAKRLDEVRGVLEERTVYAALDQPVDWSKGYTSVYVGVRKREFPRERFLQRCHEHIRFARLLLTANGIRTYFVYLTSDYYVSFSNWKSLALIRGNVTTARSRAVVANGREFMDDLVWAEMGRLPDDTVARVKQAAEALGADAPSLAHRERVHGQGLDVGAGHKPEAGSRALRCPKTQGE